MRLPILSFMCFQSQVMATQHNKFAGSQDQSSIEKKLKKSSEKRLLAENIKAGDSAHTSQQDVGPGPNL